MGKRTATPAEYIAHLPSPSGLRLILHGAPTPAAMEKRRQNHSCEQCRKAKKACNGYLMNAALSNWRAQDGESSALCLLLNTEPVSGQTPTWWFPALTA